MKCVLDASVVVKWLFADPESEPLTDEATALIAWVVDNNSAIQPVHWLAEVGGALARKTPKTMETSLILLDNMGWAVAGDIEIMQRAGRLAVDLDHHYFDTLYHAVAMEKDALLITADNRYWTKARHQGHVASLENWRDVSG